MIKKKTHPLVDLLAPNVRQAPVQVLDARDNVLDLALVGALNLARLANGHVERQAHAANRVALAQPAVAGRRRRREADLVLAGLLRREGEAALALAALRDDAVVAEGFL